MHHQNKGKSSLLKNSQIIIILLIIIKKFKTMKTKVIIRTYQKSNGVKISNLEYNFKTISNAKSFINHFIKLSNFEKLTKSNDEKYFTLHNKKEETQIIIKKNENKNV